MNLLFRFLLILLISLFRHRHSGPLDASCITLRVWPNDVDFHGHMNNGRYLSLMDFGRLDLIARLGMLRVIIRRGWFPVVGSAIIRFRRSLTPFQKYELVSRIVCWDEKWFYIEQQFKRNGDLAAIGMVKGMFRKGTKNVPPAEVLAAIQADILSPEMPQAIRIWLESEKLLAER